MTLKEDIWRYTIRNAFKHEGKADVSAVVGKIMALHKGADLKKVMPKIQETVQIINAMSFEEIEEEFKKFEKGYELKIPEKKEGLPELDWADKEKVVTRFAPNPNSPFHLGNARAAILSHEYARKYKGKFILRFDDTDPKIKKPIPEAEKIFKEDLKWLDCAPEETYFASDRLEIYYDHAKKLIEMGKAYICDCKTEDWRFLTAKQEGCPCRKKEAKFHAEQFQKMLKHEIKEGQAVLRLKTDLKHPDPSVRDIWLARVVDEPEHPRAGKKYHVWPSYNFASAIDDHLLGTTLILRGQEHAQNEVKQKFIYDYLGWSYPHSMHFGRVKLQGAILSKSKIMEGLEKGEFIGWDDPRLGTIRAFCRKGFSPQALRQAILDVGVKAADTTIELSKLEDLNKKFIDKDSDRLTFIEDPFRLIVSYCPETEVRLPVHPDYPEKGERVFHLAEGTQSFIVSKKAVQGLKPKESFRLRNAYNVRLIEKGEFDASAEFIGKGLMKKNVFFWLLEGVDLEIIMPDTSKISGLVEKNIGSKKLGAHLQLEGFGYVRLDAKNKKFTAWFTHK